MERDYFPCYHSYEKKIEKLSDQEVGRLFRALLQYSSSGQKQELTGRECIAFDFMSYDIDRAKESYEGTISKRSVAGSKGAKRKWKPEDENGNAILCHPENGNAILCHSENGNAIFCHSENGKHGYNNNDNNNDNKYTIPPSPLSTDDLDCFSDDLRSAVEDWFCYKKEKKQPYTETGRKTLITRIKNAEDAHGSSAVAGAIRRSMAANYQGIVWDWLTEPQNKPREKAQKSENHVRKTANSPSADELERLKKLRNMIRGEE